MAADTPDKLDLFVTACCEVMGALVGIEQAPEHPPEGMQDTPMVVTYFMTHDFRAAPWVVHRTHIDILLARGDLPHDEAQARKYVLRGGAALAANINMKGTCSTLNIQRADGPLPITYQGVRYFGVRFVLDVKIEHEDTLIFSFSS